MFPEFCFFGFEADMIFISFYSSYLFIGAPPPPSLLPPSSLFVSADQRFCHSSIENGEIFIWSVDSVVGLKFRIFTWSWTLTSNRNFLNLTAAPGGCRHECVSGVEMLIDHATWNKWIVRNSVLECCIVTYSWPAAEPLSGDLHNRGKFCSLFSSGASSWTHIILMVISSGGEVTVNQINKISYRSESADLTQVWRKRLFIWVPGCQNLSLGA